MSTINTSLFSYFEAPVSNTVPLKDVGLAYVYGEVKGDSLRLLTENVRKGFVSKTKVLPSVTASGTFSRRSKSGLINYSDFLCIDLDDCPINRKSELAADTFLKPVLIFLSPRGKGLKLFIYIHFALPENHTLYFEAVSLYLKGAYGIIADPSCKDVSRCCFLCHDADVYYNPDGYVTAEALLKILPALAPVETRQYLVSTPDTPAPARKTTASARNLPPAPNSCNSSKIRAISSPEIRTSDDKPSDKLNRLPEIHNLAVNALERNGWQPSGDQKGELITRPNKAVKDGCSAIYNLYEKEGIWIMTVFSNKAHPFKAHKGYSDVQILCLLDYNDDWTACISDLASRYLEPV